jgi:hypothetical protein
MRRAASAYMRLEASHGIISSAINPTRCIGVLSFHDCVISARARALFRSFLVLGNRTMSATSWLGPLSVRCFSVFLQEPNSVLDRFPSYSPGSSDGAFSCLSKKSSYHGSSTFLRK